MKKILALTCLAFLLSSTSAMAYVIDGSVADWGVDLSSAINGGSGTKPSSGYVNGDLDNNLPSGGNDIDYWTEDNADENSGRNTFVGPGYTHTGNTYDAEAIYFDNDANYIYLAIITGVAPSETTYPAGDIFINIGGATDPFGAGYVPNALGTSYAVDVSTGTLFGLSASGTLGAPVHYTASGPWEIGTTGVGSGTALGSDFVYGSTIPQPNAHYVLEAKIPMNLLGIDMNYDDNVWVHWTMKCGNDIVRVAGDVNAVPEPATIFLFSSSLLGLFGFKRKIFA